MVDANLIAEAQRKWDDTRDTSASRLLSESAVILCCDAIRLIASRLLCSGYPVADMIGVPYSDLDDRFERLRAGTGLEPPQVLRMFWSTVGHIQLTDHRECKHDTYWADMGLDAIHSDGFHICPCDDMYMDAMIWDADESAGLADDGFRYCFSPDLYEKDNCSGGGGYLLARDSAWRPAVLGAVIPEPSIVAATTRYPMDLLSYARCVILEYGGFPGFAGRRNFDQMRDMLTSGLPVF